MTAFDVRDFRQALGLFATGITVVTTATPEKRPVGVTINSFTSLSLDPPLVLFCLRRVARVLDVFMTAPGFVVHVLSARQQALSSRFAGAHAGDDPWHDLGHDLGHDPDDESGVAWSWGATGCPQIEGCLARFECQREPFLQGGDHIILVGRVTGFTASSAAAETPPLLYYRGNYARLADEA